MKSVVCNAGPLIALSGIGQVGLLPELFGEVLVSEKARGEVEKGGKESLYRPLPFRKLIDKIAIAASAQLS